MVAVAQLVESRIVIPVVVGSSPISHPIISFQKTFNPICLNPVEITLSSCVLMVAGKMSLMGLTDAHSKMYQHRSRRYLVTASHLANIKGGTTWYESVVLM